MKTQNQFPVIGNEFVQLFCIYSFELSITRKVLKKIQVFCSFFAIYVVNMDVMPTCYYNLRYNSCIDV